jgi:hypothetical protein
MPDEAATTTDTAATTQTDATAATTATTTTDAPWTKDNFDPERAQRLVENLRGDLAEQKTKSDTAIKAAVEQAKKETLAEFGRLLSGEGPIETDPEKLQAKVSDLSSKISEKDGEITKSQSDLKAANLSVAIALLAPELGGNTRALLANEKFKTSIASAEPTDEAALKAAITQALQDNAALKQPPTRTGDGNHTGPTVQSLQSQLAAAIEKKDITETIRLKQAIAAASRPRS